MSDPSPHPTREELSAYSLGQLPQERAVAIDSHISECQPCCETIVGISSDDTFVGLLKEARQLPTDQTVDHGLAPANSSDQDVPAQLAEHPRYEILGLIGKGGMGDVYKARHRKMERTVALKVINRGLVRKAEAVDRFHREAKTAAQLSHPNIVTAYDADQADDFHFMVMEYVDGVDLSQTVKDRGALPVAEACDYIRQAAIGLQHAYEQGMVHRDIKPHNLMVMADGTVKVLDFGLASLAPEAVSDADTVEARGDLTAAGAIMGTPDFISPEQADDARSADIRSDIYSLGTTLYFLLSGQPPFVDGSVMHKLKSHAQYEPDPIESLRDDIPVDLAAIISRMIAKDPGERFQTPTEVAEALAPFSKSSFPQSEQSADDKTEQTKAPPNRQRMLSFSKVASFSVLTLISVALYFILANFLAAQKAAKTKETYQQADALLESKQNIGFIEEPLQVRNVLAPMVRDLLNDKVDGAEYLRRLDYDHDSFVYDKKRRLCMFIVGNKIYLKSKVLGSSLDGLEFNTSHFSRIEKKDDTLVMNLVVADSQKAKDVCEKYGLEYGPDQQVEIDFEGLLNAAPSNLRTLLKDGERVHSKALSDDIDVRQILDRMEKAYAECKSYRDSGVIKSVFSKSTGLPETTVEHSFTTAFVRPDRFRFEIKDEDNKLLISANGKDVQTWWDVEPGVKQPESLEFAMAQAAGFTGGDAGRIPAMLMPQKLEISGGLDLIDPKQIEDGKLQSVECFRLEYNFRDEQFTLWIDKQSYLVRRIDERIKVDRIRIERTTTYDPTIDGKITDEMLEFLPEGDLKQLQGDWELLTVQEGDRRESNPLGNALLTIKGNSLLGQNWVNRIEIDANKTPKTIDFYDPRGGLRLRGIYKFHDNRLIMILHEDDKLKVENPAYPESFDPPADNDTILWELRKATRDGGAGGRSESSDNFERKVGRRFGAKAMPNDVKPIQGEWRIASAIDGGAPRLRDDSGVLRVTGNAYSLAIRRKSGEIVFKRSGLVEIDNTKNPRTIDLSDSENSGNDMAGIYEIKGDTLRICLEFDGRPGERPKTFESPANTDILLIECQRRQPEEDTREMSKLPSEAKQGEPIGKTVKKRSAIALANGCEVTAGFTVEQAEITIKNPTHEPKTVSFYYQVVYQDSRERGDIFVIAGGKFESELPPGRSELKRVDILPDPNRGAPHGHVKDMLAIRVSQERPGYQDIPIVPGKKLDIAKQSITIATQATPGYSAAARPLEKLQDRFGPEFPGRISPIKGEEKSDPKTTRVESAATQIKLLEQALDLYKLKNGAYPSTNEGLKTLVEEPADENRAKNWSGYFLATEQLPLDPWGNAYSYEFPGTRGGDRSKPNIWSLGPDGKPNTDDDVNNWDNKPAQEVDSEKATKTPTQEK